MANDRLHRFVETQCGNDIDADFEAFADDMHDVLASRICGARDDGEANSLGSDFVELQQHEYPCKVWGTTDLSVFDFYQYLLGY